MGIYDDILGGQPQAAAPPPASSGAVGGFYDDILNGPTAATPAPAPTEAPSEPTPGVYSDILQTEPAPPPDWGGFPAVSKYVTETAKAFAQGGRDFLSSAMVGLAANTGGPAPTPFGVMQPMEENLRQNDPTYPRVPLQQNPIYQAGKSVEDVGREVLKRSPGWENSFTLDLASGAGSLVAGIGLGITSSRIGLGPVPVGVVYTYAGGGQQLEDAMKHGATPEQIRDAVAFGNVAGATDMVDMMLASLGSTGKALGLIRKVGVAAVAEGLQEGGQQWLQNLIAKGIYDPNRDLMEDVPKNFLIGAILGGGVGAATHVVGERPSTSPTPEMIDKAFGTLVGPNPAPAPVSEPPVTAVEVPPPGEPFYPPPSVTPKPTEPAVPPPTVAPTATPNPTTDIPSNVIDFLAKKKAKIVAPDKAPTQEEVPPDPNAPLAQEITGQPGANVGRLAKLLGPKLYGEPTNMTPVTVKELVQNSFDAIKASLESGLIDEGNVTIDMDHGKRTISVHDNGSGMTPEVLAKQFLEIAGTHKESSQASGGLGIAKMLFLFANKQISVITMRDGKVARLSSSGDQLFAAMEDPSKSPKIQISEPTEAERSLFPDGHGTVVRVTVPNHFIDSSTGERNNIDFPDWLEAHSVLKNSPLFHNVNVVFNGEKVPIGKAFPYDDYTHFADAKFEWGTARIYVSQKPEAVSPFIDNMHILSNGLWQFSRGFKKDPAGGAFSENAPRQVYVDLKPSVQAEDPGYPFDLNRQRFAKTAEEDLNKIFNYMSLLYRHEDFANEAVNFGSLYYLGDAGLGDGSVSRSKPIDVQPKHVEKGFSDFIHPGDKISVKNGQLFVNGREVPVLDVRKISELVPDTNKLVIPQSEIRPDVPMVHDNTIVVISELEKRSITELAEEKFGERFHRFMFGVGDLFRELRDTVADSMGYESLKEEGIGISFDTKYRGVSIRVPFSGSFINPAVPEYTDPVRAGVGVVGTMVHELAHHQVRSHNAEFPAEMQRILINLDAHPEFDFHAFKQEIVNLYAENEDIFNYLNGFYSGAFTLETRGKRFQDSGSNEARDAGPSGTMAPPRGPTTGGPNVYSGPQEGTTSSQQQPVGGKPRVAATGAGELSISESPARSKLTDFNKNAKALRAIDKGVTVPFPQDELTPLREGMENLYQATKKRGGGTGAPPPPVQQAIAHGDRIVRGTKWWFGLDRLVDRYPRLTPLVRYWETTRQMLNETAKIHDAATRIAKEWRHLGNRAEPLAALIDDIANMTYRNSQEVANGIARHPTQKEFGDLVRKHKVSAEALRVFNMQKKFFEDFLQIITQNARETAQRTITDPRKLADQLDVINTRMQNLLGRPYFPFLRFGNHAVVVKDQAGHTVLFQTYERKGFIPAVRRQLAAKKQLEKTVPPGYTVQNIVLPESAIPFIGLPPELLESIQKELQLTPDQKIAMEQIRYELSPAASFAHRFQNKNYTPGYSHDFLRAFSRYAFHGARYHARTKYAWSLRQNISDLEKMQGNLPGTIANYLTDHLTNTILDTKGDFGILKGAIFLWVFGYSVAGAYINLSQMPMISYPFLAAKFGGAILGDARAAKAMAKAMTDVKNFYKKGSYENVTDFEMKAISYAIKSGRISEAMAAELAGLAQGESLLSLGNNRASRGVQAFMSKASFLFEMAEQVNRRVTYRAALDLAMRNPNAKGVQEAINKYSDEYAKLQGMGFNQSQAAAIVAASYAVEQTQFNYSRETRPRFMRGKLAGTLFVFKTYMVNVLQLLGANKSSVMPRYLIITALMAGLMGIPGAEDVLDLIKLIGKWLFGKDFRPEQQLQQFVNEITNGELSGDVVLHGLSRRGFGIPALLDMIGEHPGRGLGTRTLRGQNLPIPSIDMSRSLSMGRILPVSIDKLTDPGRDSQGVLADQIQQGSGAIFGFAFNLYKALQDYKTPTTDIKRWERVMPRALAGLSRSYRAYTEARTRGSGGPQGAATVLPFDTRDPEQMAEIVAMGLGFMPTRMSTQWDATQMKMELNKSYQIQREMLLRQAYEAQSGGKKDEIEKTTQAIRDFNKDLPVWAKGYGLTGEAVRKSLQVRYSERRHREANSPSKRSEFGVSKHIDALFPESVVDAKRVR